MEQISLKNRRTIVAASKSIAMIEEILVKAGATNISKFYDNGRVTGFYFSLLQRGGPLSFKLPAKTEKVYAFLCAKYAPKTAKQKADLKEQAERTAFKTLYEWVFININMWQMDQVELLEVLLPYTVNSEGKTFFERVTENSKLLS